MGILWLRLYSDLPDHVRMRKLPEETQLFLVWYWCKWKTGDIVAGASVEDVAWTLRLDADRVRRDMGNLIDAEYLDEDGTPTNWEHRQFPSDSSTDRVRKHREQTTKRYMERSSNALESESETESETESEKNTLSDAASDGAGSASRQRAPKPDPYAEDIDTVLAYLNVRRKEIAPGAAGYDISAKGTRKHLRARLVEGATRKQCIDIIDDRLADWHKKPELHRYFRPSTLFNSDRFPEYLANIGVGGSSEDAERRKFLAMGDD